MDSGSAAIKLALETILMKKQALMFVSTKRSAEKAAEDIAKKIREKDSSLEKLSLDALHALLRPTKQCRRLASCLAKGVAFHHAGLVLKQRELVEDAFRQGRVKVICSTPTLAAGLDLPAFRAIIRDVKRFSRQGMQFIPTLEVQQMFGRAGRPAYDSYGEAICIASNEAEREEIEKRYIYGTPEDIHSKLAVEPALRTYLLSLIAGGFVGSDTKIMEFFSKTFWAHQFGEMQALKAILDRMIGLLLEWEFVRVIGGAADDDFVSADSIGKKIYRATLLGTRVAQLYLDPLTAHEMIMALKRADPKAATAFSYLHMISRTLELRPLLRVRMKEFDMIQDALIKNGEALLFDEPAMFDPEYDEFMASVKTAHVLDKWIGEYGEDVLMDDFSITPGELRSKIDTGEWLLHAAEEFSKLLGFRGAQRELSKLRVRLKYGVREELLALLKLKNIGRVRARKMFLAGIHDIGDVRKADPAKLKQLIGEKTALDVKAQVGQEIKAVPDGKRKGQTGLGKFSK